MNVNRRLPVERWPPALAFILIRINDAYNLMANYAKAANIDADVVEGSFRLLKMIVCLFHSVCVYRSLCKRSFNQTESNRLLCCCSPMRFFFIGNPLSIPLSIPLSPSSYFSRYLRRCRLSHRQPDMSVQMDFIGTTSTAMTATAAPYRSIQCRRYTALSIQTI